MIRNRMCLPAIVASLVAAAACAPKKLVKLEETPVAVSTSPVSAEEGNIRGADYYAAPELKVVHFDYDSYLLGESARETLKRNAEFLKSHPELEVQIAGHCDTRGTVQYNLGLGQKRANAARDYYSYLGVAGKSMATISYGKEKPICQESTEDCWARNRRDETLVRKASAQ